MKITKNYLTGKVEINENSKIFGRSAYLCYNEKCIEMAFKKNRLNKSAQFFMLRACALRKAR